ncbi:MULTISPECIES: hypothetical protein [Mammaliicoccus]|uniref:hypothetical protein n=1 Tax=Mammaliicoccus TaxID=2803850 RepID=UPI000D1EB82C|nr:MULTISPECIES: hypothetical protein [Mammaliicoccus]MCE5058303.1 hypothetical protein [Mammaliicoccus sciuri]PTJ44715.1 hypothetical protein BUZ98_09355 [Mammaliicoccus sciuri]PTK25460.1 hypothetical protein BUZ86_09505 [Mammaliicoccus sciuri]RIN89942.1 hypothetical protein BU003_09000 [Mammaliicoccus sciuri]RIO17440.1 hypothetical protein BUZ88_07340 [Mammaliicoccus sciuri]
MSEYVTRNEFEQYEKRVDERLDTLNNKIDHLPNIIQDKITISMNNLERSINETNKKNRKAVIASVLSGVGVLITLAGLIGNILGVF